MTKNRRNNENTNEIVQYNHMDLRDLKKEVKDIQGKLDNVVFLVQKSTLQTVMDESDISVFFPVTHADQIDQFMDRDHQEWNSRRKAFYNYLFTTITESKRAFSKGLLKSLFTRDFMLDVKWPTFG